MGGGGNNHGTWAPGCSNHCYLTFPRYAGYDYRVPMKSDFSLIQSISDWIEGVGVSNRHIDSVEWPLNKLCSGLGR